MSDLANKHYPTKKIWQWIPTLYFMEGLPFSIIVIASLVFYKDIGLTNQQITFYTGWFFLPWMIKPLWSWFVELWRPKVWWIYTMEILIGIIYILIILSLQLSQYIVISLSLFVVVAILSASHDIATDGFYLATLTDSQQSFFVGMNSLFYQIAKLFGGGLCIVLAGVFIHYLHFSVKGSWSIIFIVVAIITVVVGCYHNIALPKQHYIHNQHNFSMNNIKDIITTFFKLDQIWVIILLAITFRLGENLVLKIVPLFILDSTSNGGLGFSETYLGTAHIFIFGAMIGASICGGLLINKFGLKKCLLPMLLGSNVPHFIYVWLAVTQPKSHIVVLCLQTIEYFTTTLALTGYTMLLFYSVRNSKYKTTHYSIITGIMMSSIMLPSMVSGWLENYLGYSKFFIIVLFILIPSLLILPFIKVDAKFGQKIKQ
jgi:PAT family beta-lactamase induction signal transducer AmpG